MAVRITIGNKELYDGIWHTLNELKKIDQIDVKETRGPIYLTVATIMPEFKSLNDELNLRNIKIKERNDEKASEIYELIDKLSKLGCEIDDYSVSSYENLEQPNKEWFTYEKTAHYDDCQIKVLCHGGTLFYQFMDTYGFIEKCKSECMKQYGY